MAYRDDTAALEARKRSLDAEVAAKTRERDGVALLIDEHRREDRLIDAVVNGPQRRLRRVGWAIGLAIAAILGTVVGLHDVRLTGPEAVPVIILSPRPVIAAQQQDTAMCDRAGIERERRRWLDAKHQLLGKLYSRERAVPGEIFEGVVLGSSVGADIRSRIDAALSTTNIHATFANDKLSIWVAHYDATHPGSCDPAGPCDCIPPYDERFICQELAQQLEAAWGARKHRPMFVDENSYDELTWIGRGGHRATHDGSCNLVFDKV